MLTPGIVGGIGPESTIAYYRRIIAECRRRNDSWPKILIHSMDLKHELGLVEHDRAGLIDFMADSVRSLQAGGADFALFASNTPHIVFDEVQRQVGIPMLSIVDAACDAARQLGLRKLALFGTSFTMDATFYPERFAPAGIAIVTPDERERQWIHDKYMNELVLNILRPETKKGLLDIVERMKRRDKIDGVLLAGTELPLILQDNGGTGIPFLDTAVIHADAAVSRMLA